MAAVRVEPEKGFDCGAGPGKVIERDVRGVSVGLILDARGRPLVLPADRAASAAQMARWVDALDLYPKPGDAAS
jgi:hypothetical protein